MTSQYPQTKSPNSSALPNELWIRSFSYLDENDLFQLGNVSRNFLSMASADSLWETHCLRRWEGKQNIQRFCKRDTSGGCNNTNDGRVAYCVDLIRQFPNAHNVPALNMGSLLHEPTSWKEAYILAEIDSRRRIMTREELIHFKWQLVYDGSPSRLGLRQFDANGMYLSPYMGMCEWVLRGEYLMFAGMSLYVERNEKSWGWVIGGGQRTEYHSVEADH